MKAIIRIDVPEYQIGQEVSCYFKDTMNVYGVCEAERTGHWIRERISPRGVRFRCSECERVSARGENFCPKCGADMRGDTE